jgi:hypothetical protein
MKKVALWVLVGFVVGIAAGCVTTRPRVGPPPLRTEVMTASPGPHFVWIGGTWRWNGHDYVWAPGYWAKMKRGRNWVPGHWVQRGPHWHYVKGHWR